MTASGRVAMITALAAASLPACTPGEAPSKQMASPPALKTAEQIAEPHEEAPMVQTPAEQAEAGRLEAHEHGRATLVAALEGDSLTVTFEAPLMSMAGFERAVQTPEEQATIDALKDEFLVPDNMVSVNRDAGCRPLMTQADTHIAGAHGALEVMHLYTCDRPDEIDSIDFLMFGDYPALDAIEAVYVGETSQSAGELTPRSYTLEVR